MNILVLVPYSRSYTFTVPLILLLLPVIYCTLSSQLSSPFSTTTIPTPYHTIPHHTTNRRTEIPCIFCICHLLGLDGVAVVLHGQRYVQIGPTLGLLSSPLLSLPFFPSIILPLIPFPLPLISPSSHSPFLSSRIPPPYDYHYLPLTVRCGDYRSYFGCP